MAVRETAPPATSVSTSNDGQAIDASTRARRWRSKQGTYLPQGALQGFNRDVDCAPAWQRPTV